MAFNKTIWIIEDDPGAQFVYNETLGHRYSLNTLATLGEFKELLKAKDSHPPDLIIADIRLPDGTFLEYLASSEYDQILALPFIIVSSVDDIDALRFCFDEGALDYLTKPFGKAELVVKVERLLSGKVERPERFGKKKPYEKSNTVKREIYQKLKDSLTNKEAAILALLVEDSKNALSRNHIYDSVWKGVSVHPKTLDVHLYNLRRKLKAFGFDICSNGSGAWELLSQRMDC